MMWVNRKRSVLCPGICVTVNSPISAPCLKTISGFAGPKCINVGIILKRMARSPPTSFTSFFLPTVTRGVSLASMATLAPVISFSSAALRLWSMPARVRIIFYLLDDCGKPAGILYDFLAASEQTSINNQLHVSNHISAAIRRNASG